MVNAAILNTDGTQITGDKYWSSREDGSAYYYGMAVSLSTGIPNLQYKQEDAKIRAIASF